MIRRAGFLIGVFLLALVVCQPATAARRPSPAPSPTVYTVPKKIQSDCSVPVENKIMAWLATVPDGSTVQFGPGRCYGQDGTITLSGRSGLVIDGRDSEFRALTPGGSHRANWRLVNGGNLTLQNMAVRGTNPQGSYDPAIEWQHGYSVEGVQGIKLLNVKARETWGDGVMLWRGAYTPTCGDDASSARDVEITGALIERSGRQGVAIVDAEYVKLQNSTVGPVAWSNVDIETDDDCEIARHIDIVGNQFGANRYGVIASVGFGGDPQVGDITVTDNTQTAATGLPGECWAPVRILSPTALYRSGYVFLRNRFLARRNALEFRRVRNIDVSSNNVTLTPTTGCGQRAGVLLVDSHTVNITSNLFSGANYVFRADTLSTVTASDNTTN